MKEENLDFLWLLKICKKHIRVLSLLLVLTSVLSSLISVYCIESKFQSSVIIYPTTTNSVSQALLVDHNPYRKDVLEFGEEEEAEQLLQVLNSDEMRDSIIMRFNLYHHYDVGQDDEFSKTTVNTMYSNLVSIKKTKFNSIEIIVLDKDPIMASNIANEYLTLMDVVISRIRKKRSQQALTILESRKKLLYKQRNLIQDSVQDYRSNGIISVGTQVERLTEQYAIALAANNLNGARRIKEELNHLAQHAGAHDMLLRKSYAIENELSKIEFESDRVLIDTNYALENKFIINKAYPADKKSYPVRWLIVISSLISVFVFSIISLSISEYFNINNDKKK